MPSKYLTSSTFPRTYMNMRNIILKWTGQNTSHGQKEHVLP